MPKMHNRALINGTGKSEYPHAKEGNWTCILYIKIDSKLIKNLNVRLESVSTYLKTQRYSSWQ